MRKVIVSVLVSLISLSAFSQHKHDFRIVGYVMQSNIPKLTAHELGMITHLCVAFINPDENGNIHFGPYIGSGNIGSGESTVSSAVSKAKKYGVKTSISLAGGGFWGDKIMIERYKRLMNDDNRQKFINNLVAYIGENNLDGIDVDIEGDCVNNYLGDFMEELSDTCHKRGWEVTAAWPAQGQWSDMVSDKALANVDYIYIMSYDATGAWAPNNPGQHAPYHKSVKDIQYYKKRNVKDSSIVLGVPFYGKDFTGGTVVGKLYPEIVGLAKDASQQDSIGMLWYNGQPTIQKKTELAIDNGNGGVMVWEITQDVKGKQSLLNTIYKTSLPALCSEHTITYTAVEKNIVLSNLPKEEILAITILKDDYTFQKAISSKQIKRNGDALEIKLKKYQGKIIVIRTNKAHFKIILK